MICDLCVYEREGGTDRERGVIWTKIITKNALIRNYHCVSLPFPSLSYISSPLCQSLSPSINTSTENKNTEGEILDRRGWVWNWVHMRKGRETKKREKEEKFNKNKKREKY